MQMTLGRTWRRVVMLFLLVPLFAACSPRPPAPTEPTQTPSTAETARKADIAPRTMATQGNTGALAARTAGNDPILNPDVSGTIEFWHFWASPVRHNALRRVISLCQQKLPNITVIDTIKPFNEIWTANLAAVGMGTGMPDVIVSDRRTLPRDAGDGVYTSLQEWADRDNVRREQFYNWAWDQAVYEGQVYGIPHETDVRVMFYNKTLFQQAGLDPNKPPKTWAEVEQYADKLDKIDADGKIERVGFFPLWSVSPDTWQYTNDADMLRMDGTPQIDNPKMVETVEWIKKWIDRYGGWEKIQSFRNQFDSSDQLFMSSAVAMYLDIFGYNSQLQFYRPTVQLDNGDTPRMDWGIALIPYNTKPGTWSGGFSLSIPMGAKNPEAAWEFIKCATSSEGQVSWARDTQAQPTNLRAATDPSLLADPAWGIVDEALQTSTGGIYVTRYPNWAEQLNQRWEMVWRGELAPAQMLAEAQRAVEEALK